MNNTYTCHFCKTSIRRNINPILDRLSNSECTECQVLYYLANKRPYEIRFFLRDAEINLQYITQVIDNNSTYIKLYSPEDKPQYLRISGIVDISPQTALSTAIRLLKLKAFI